MWVNLLRAGMETHILISSLHKGLKRGQNVWYCYFSLWTTSQRMYCTYPTVFMCVIWLNSTHSLLSLSLPYSVPPSPVFEEPEDPSARSFFSEIISSVSDVKFSHSGRYLLTRDYLTAKVWDLNMESKPLETYQVCDRPRVKDTLKYGKTQEWIFCLKAQLLLWDSFWRGAVVPWARWTDQ